MSTAATAAANRNQCQRRTGNSNNNNKNKNNNNRSPGNKSTNATRASSGQCDLFARPCSRGLICTPSGRPLGLHRVGPLAASGRETFNEQYERLRAHSGQCQRLLASNEPPVCCSQSCPSSSLGCLQSGPEVQTGRCFEQVRIDSKNKNKNNNRKNNRLRTVPNVQQFARILSANSTTKHRLAEL